jgi:ligand-binding sensor domain-containing protein
MALPKLHRSIYALLPLLLFLCSCNGQEKPQAVQQEPLKTFASPTAKLKKTAGSNEYQSVNCGIEDKQGNLWFGTTGEGVYRYDGKLFTQFTMKDGLNSNSIWCMMEDHTGKIWIGTSNGICRWDGNKMLSVTIDQSIRPLITDNNYYTEWSTKNSVWSIFQDNSGKIWFGAGDGLYYYDGMLFNRLLANNSIINEDSLHLKVVSDILQDKNGILWFFSGILPGNEGICRFDGKKLERIKPRENGWNRNAFESKTGKIIVATRHYGIWASDGKTFGEYVQPKEMIGPSLNYVFEDHAGTLWVASDYGAERGDMLGGLWYSNASDGKLTEDSFVKIFHQEVYFVMEDKEGNIWFGTTNTGLYQYDRKNLTCYSE